MRARGKSKRSTNPGNETMDKKYGKMFRDGLGRVKAFFSYNSANCPAAVTFFCYFFLVAAKKSKNNKLNHRVNVVSNNHIESSYIGETCLNSLQNMSTPIK